MQYRAHCYKVHNRIKQTWVGSLVEKSNVVGELGRQIGSDSHQLRGNH